MASNPIVSWLNSSLIQFGDTNHPEVPKVMQFNDGTYGNPLLADTDSAPITFYIANNFTNGVAASTACFDMKNCTLTTKAEDGSMNEQLVQEKWVRVKSVSKGETDYTQVGAHLDGASYVEDSHPIGCGDSTIGVNNISGAANDGTITGTGKNNVAQISAMLHSSVSPSVGKHSGKFRVTYTYGTT